MLTIFTIINPSIKPNTVEIKSPEMTFFHSLRLMALIFLFTATAAPVRDAIRAWLSLVGMPKNQAATAHITIERSAALIASDAVLLSLPKSEMFVIDETTFPLNCDITKTPEKFIIDARIIAFFGVIVLDEIQVAIAVGASVQPFTIITPEISMYEKTRIGFCNRKITVSGRSKNYQSSRMSAIILPDAVSKGSLRDPLKPVSSLQRSSFSMRISPRIPLSLSEKA